ncbi:hypothetical protein [Acetobacterium bakii]|uniref:VWFA domain-containing protein n=1 Tax=Acetobacterium bakii TaxID=52689 RepID=A0A0L6TWI2_9FIRM|nr:hypothetical protein [Acetobacterium bakii]KNZ40634.1 hypothetical protein AKG39_16590 [Acetobacterium bakii]
MKETFRWEYEDFEFDNRVSNLMWTVCGDYKAKISADEKSATSKEVALYHGIAAGSRRKYLDWPTINAYYSHRIQHGYDRIVLLALIQMGGDLLSFRQMIDERPGIFDIRQRAFIQISQTKVDSPDAPLIQLVDYLLSKRLSGVNYSISPEVDQFCDAIESLADQTNTLNFLEKVDSLYKDYYHPNYSRSFSSLDFLEKQTLNEDLETTIASMLDHLTQKNDNQMETSGMTDIADAEVVYINPEAMENIQHQVIHYYGIPYLKAYTTKKMQNRLCRGVHLDCKLHFTDGVLRSGSDSAFQQKYAHRDKQKNLAAFRLNFPVYRQNISRLRDGLIRTLTSERSSYSVPSTQGKIVANRVWRVGRSPLPKIFEKIESNNKGDFVVDLLLDSSNSQQSREHLVSIQAYTVAQALTEAGIPCRVNGFSSFLNYTVIKRFRDYDALSQDNENIFEYSCLGSNRDGLAIKSICHHLSLRPEENKILIILSDGRPNDIKLIPKENANQFRGETAYTGGIAIGDTAKEVRRARQQGIMVLGVFTGQDSDLSFEKLIYGKDFVYSKNIHHFADVVMTYLKRIICQ